MASTETTQRPTEPTPARPAHSDSPLESLGKAISDPVREAAGQADEATRKARENARPDPYPDLDAEDDWPEPPSSPVHGR
ncbi:hypothetical protein [Pseudorhodoferax sp.]|uniref:hypothetical protein n=1 Tax=Pseudorhodoferax sp. TaxID=1993553 RepID=UPI002DD64FB3|nr:hypothetical protein [Pseudorhodoferax sp.]